MIYFARADNSVKIGFSRYVPTRMRTIKGSNHSELKLMAVIPGGRTREKRLHERFAKDRIRGEWFELTPELNSFISHLPPYEIGKREVKVSVMEENIRDNLTDMAEAYCRIKGITMTTLSKNCYGHRNFLKEFSSGQRSITVGNLQKVIYWFDRNWPPDARWPAMRPIYMKRGAHIR